MSDKFVESFNIMGLPVYVRDVNINKFLLSYIVKKSTISNSSDAIQDYINNNPNAVIIVDNGNHILDRDVTFTSGIKLFFSDGYFTLLNSAKLTINCNFDSLDYQLFYNVTPDTLIIDTTKNSIGKAEWFGDNIVECYKYFNNIDLKAKTYTLTSDLSLNRSNTNIKGIGASEYTGANKTDATRIIETQGATIRIGDPSSGIINSFPRNIHISDMQIVQTVSTQYAIYSNGIVYGRIRRLKIDGSGSLVYVKANVSTLYEDIVAQLNAPTVGTSFIYYLDGSGTPIGAGGNASVYFNRCNGQFTTPNGNKVYGFYLNGASADTYINSCEITACSCGIAFEGHTDGDQAWNDIFVNNFVADSVTEHGLDFVNINSNGAIQLNQIYLANVPNATQSQIFISNTTCPITMSNVQMIDTSPTAVGLQIVGTASLIMHGMIYKGMGTPFQDNDNREYLLIDYFVNGHLNKIGY